MKSIFIKIAGILNLITALIHTLAGQTDLVNPLISSEMEVQQVGELVAVWHITTVLLFLTSYFLLKAGFLGVAESNVSLINFIAYLYLLSSLPFIISGFWFSIFAPQWILLLPIGLLLLIGIRKYRTHQLNVDRQ